MHQTFSRDITMNSGIFRLLAGVKVNFAWFAFFGFFSSVWCGETFTFTDKLNRRVTLNIPVKRAVLLTGADLLPITGAWNRVVGISNGSSEENDLLKAVRPDLETLIPAVGSNRNVNIEMLMKLNPDIVLTWSFNPEIINYLEKKKVPVIAVFPESITELYEVMRLHGKIFDGSAGIESTIEQMEKIFTLIKTGTADIKPEQRKKALWLFGKPTRIAGRDGIYGDVLALTGQQNLGAAIPRHYADTSLEQIALWNPEVIYIWGRSRYSAADILNNRQWRHIEAVKNKRVFKSPQWDTWSPRLAPLALWMAAAVYPEQFKGVDINGAIERFFREVYKISYEDVRQIEN